MSAGSHPIPRSSGGVRRTPWAAGKPRHTGLPLIPRVVFDELDRLLASQGSAGLLVAFCALRLEASEVVSLRNDPSHPGQFVVGVEGDAFDLPDEEAHALEQALGFVTKRGFDGPRLARWLYGQGRVLQRQIVDRPWAMHVRVSVHLLHLVGDELAVESFGSRLDQLRAYARSRYARPDDLRPRSSGKTVAPYGVAMQDFFGAATRRGGDVRSLHAAGEPDPAATSLSASLRAQFLSALHRARRVLLLGRAGTGKTTTLCAGVEQMAENGRTGLHAFNRAVVAELRRKVRHLGQRVHVSTVDAECHACYRAAHPKEHLLSPEEQIVLVKQSLLECGGADPDAPRLAGWYASQLQQGSEPAEVFGEETAARYGELKRAHAGFDSSDVTRYLADDPERLANHLCRNEGLRKTVIDEAHDLSAPGDQALTIFSQRGQVVLAGDDEQAINGHRGADHEAFVRFGELEDAEVIELTVTWRSSTALVEACLNPFRERWFAGREPLVAGNGSPIREAFSVEMVPGGEGAVFAILAAEVASLRTIPKRRGTMGSIPPNVLRGASSIRAPLVGVLCARNADVVVAEVALKEFGISPIVLRRAPLHPRTDPLLEVLLAALDPHDRTSFLGGHVDPSWAPRHLLSALAKAPGRKLRPRDQVAAQLLRNVDALYCSDKVELVGPNVVLATVNQVKGLTFDFVWIVVPARKRFPYGDPHAWDERCRWWVALTRARHLVRVLVSDGVSVPYLP
ncbi:MAG: UvrD-helicase domain-containing protein [Acidimicrobiales bacterium]